MIKRSFDVLAAGLGLLALSPVMLGVALSVRLFLGGPVLYRQVRPGLHGRSFTLVKFRTMRDAVDPDGVALPDRDRMTGLGRFLRAASLDELPELWNVLKGDMSLVGPRPLLTHYLPLYSAEQARRHEVRPGITGWAQINGRNHVDWETRFQLDTWYVDHHTLWLDMKILTMTVFKVFRAEGVSQKGHATMEEFRGSDQ